MDKTIGIEIGNMLVEDFTKINNRLDALEQQRKEEDDEDIAGYAKAMSRLQSLKESGWWISRLYWHSEIKEWEIWGEYSPQAGQHRKIIRHEDLITAILQLPKE